jgi:hypothetical protein
MKLDRNTIIVLICLAFALVIISYIVYSRYKHRENFGRAKGFNRVSYSDCLNVCNINYSYCTRRREFADDTSRCDNAKRVCVNMCKSNSNFLDIPARLTRF